MRYLVFIVLLSLTGIACADTGGEIADEINNVICLFVRLIWLVTGSLMALVIIFAGVKWLVSSEDAGARASAKTFIVSAFVGLIIIFTAVPVVDYLVGGIIGYEFGCGFFPEVNSDFLNTLNSADASGEEPYDDRVLVPLSVDPLEDKRDLVFKEVVFSRNLEDTSGGPLYVCLIVEEVSGSIAVENLKVAAYLDRKNDPDMVITQICSKTIGSIGKGDTGQIDCKIDPELLESIRKHPEEYRVTGEIDPENKFIDAEKKTKNHRMEKYFNDLKEDPNCPGEMKLFTLSAEECSSLDAKAKDKIKGEWGDYSKEITVTEDTEMVALYAEFKGQAESFTWDLSWGHTGDKNNKQMFGLYPQDLPTEPETDPYTATITVKTATETCTDTISIIVPSLGEEIIYPVDVARIGLVGDGRARDFPKKRRVVQGSGKVILYADWRGRPLADEFLWKVNGREIKGQMPPAITWDQLPQTLGEHRIDLTVKAKGKTYTDEVFIVISAEETTEEECIKEWGKWLPSGLDWPFGSYIQFGETSCCGDDPSEAVVCEPGNPDHCSCCAKGYDEISSLEGRCYTTSTKTCGELGGTCCPAGTVCRQGYEVEGSCEYSGSGCSIKTLCAKVAQAVEECGKEQPYNFCSSGDVCKAVGNMWNACVKNGYSASGADGTCPEEVCYNVYATLTICSSVYSTQEIELVIQQSESSCIENHACRMILEALEMCPASGECCKECVTPQEAIECDESMDVCINDEGCKRSWLQSGEEEAFGGYKRYGQSGCCGDDTGEKAVCDREGIGKKCRCCMTDKNTVDGSGRCAISGKSESKEDGDPTEFEVYASTYEKPESSLRPEQKYLDDLCGEDSGTFVESPENPFDSWTYLLDCSAICGEGSSTEIEIISCHGPMDGGKYWCGCCCS